VAERGFTIGSGYGKNKETSIRIGHMGDHTLEGLERCLAACDSAFDLLLG
jgi:aspartate aminotransferase-like enzyme